MQKQNTNDIGKELNEKIELFENRIELLRKDIEEKDMKILNLEKQIKTFVKKKEKPIIKCLECDFTTSSEHGLRIHKRKTHNSHKDKQTEKDYPQPCELCDKVMETKIKMRNHMKTHS